ncbi:hypothetical protein AB0P12_13225 [Streptomyces subrutilus]|uniref:hypothetical protein n=1 Tax=Streptomyces subrutilus TaxID=36818 RepID=UPI00341A87C1
MAVEKAESRSKEFGSYNSSTLAYHADQVRFELGDMSGSVNSLQEHFRLRDSSDSRRSEIRFSLMLAERQFAMGHLEAACQTWGKALEEVPTIHSGRVDAQVAKITSLLRPHQANAAAREIYDRCRAG